MSARRAARHLLSAVLRHYRHEIVPVSQLYDWQKHSPERISSNNNSRLPEGAEAYLRVTHPRLVELQDRYSRFDSQVTAPLVWTPDHVSSDDILYFRGDTAYVWQRKGMHLNVLAYALSTFYVKSIDTHNLLASLEEDELFGNCIVEIDNRPISRDLLDSIVEIYFLDRHLSIASSDRRLRILDIGAGYGRLAHRLLNACPKVRSYWCTDGVATSTFISDYYLRFRNLEDRAKAIPLDEIEDAMKHQTVDIALNIHSFSECTTSAIEWWLSLLAKHGVGHLMIVPNHVDRDGERLLSNDRKDMRAIVERHGFTLIAKEPKYREPVVQQYGMYPVYHYLFQLR